ncbi:class I SAM-dependent methyltransferase [Pelobium manganitolerans]|nr:class I SAM-dependent methyltransferase [Pelobium manganitolerans]
MDKSEVVFEAQCVADVGKVFYYQDKVYRSIARANVQDEIKQLISADFFPSLVESGLIDTKIAELDLIDLRGHLILEHKMLRAFLHPAEYTNKMFYEGALTIIHILKILTRNGYVLKDGHSFNITNYGGRFFFFDFTSITKSSSISYEWFEEFYKYFAIPIYLASKRQTYALAKEYRREHKVGLGLKLADNKFLKNWIFRELRKCAKNLNKPILFVNELEAWLLRHPPVEFGGYWDNYNQDHSFDIFTPRTVKQRFVYDILSAQPSRGTLIDLACNQGYYSFMADHLGYNVVAVDYEEGCLNKAFAQSQGKNISYAHIDFCYPTPSFGIGNVGPNSIQRFKSDFALALGLIHHICITQRFSVKLFCETCILYSDKGVIVEFVFPDDKYVKAWEQAIPEDYNIDSIKRYFQPSYSMCSLSEVMNDDGVHRQFLYFFK